VNIIEKPVPEVIPTWIPLGYTNAKLFTRIAPGLFPEGADPHPPWLELQYNCKVVMAAAGGQAVITGVVLSITVTVKLHWAVLPATSLAV
jgi:hypothetical protein